MPGFIEKSAKVKSHNRESTDLDVTHHDIHLQFDLFGNSLSLSAWRDGDARPTTPQIAINDDAYSQGHVRLFHNIGTTSDTTSMFRLFEANAEVPMVTDGLQAGDADQDLDFDQLDLVKVQIATG